MKRRFEEPEMQVIVFGSDDTMICASGLTMTTMYGGYDGGNLGILLDDETDDK